MNMILAIAAGGALGATMRHGIGAITLKIMGASFPWATISVNVIGSLVMGFLVAYFAHHWQPSAEIKAFLTVGFLGAFTTFSAFSLDFVNLWERGDIFAALIYAAMSVILSIGGLLFGMMLTRQIIL